MKKSIFALALVTAGFAAAPAFAQDDTQSPPPPPASQDASQDAPQQLAQEGWYVGASAGYADYNKGPYNDGDFAGGINGGYRFAINPETSLGIEAGYVYLGRPSAKGSYKGLPDSTAKGKAKLQGATLGFDLRYHFNQYWFADLRAGAWSAKGEGVTDTSSDNSQFQKFRKTRGYAGVGVGYNITSQWSVGLAANYYGASGDGTKLNPYVYTVNTEFRF